jgi:hypothetical protein
MHGKIVSFIAIMTITMFSTMGGTWAEEDDRQLIKVDPTLKAQVLKEMRQLTERLDDVLAALSDGDFKQVARLGEIHLGFGHSKLEAMLADGASEEQIQARRVRMKQNRAAREKAGVSGHGSKESLFGITAGSMGLGQKLPEEFWLMGQSMHGAAEQMAVAARAAGSQPTVDDYKAVTARIQEMTTACRGCHSAYRLP